MSTFDSWYPGAPGSEGASDLGRTLWIRTLLGEGEELPSGSALAQRMRNASFEKGEYLYRIGEESDRIYFVVRGSVQLAHLGVKAREFGPQSVLGLIDASEGRPHAFDAIALEDTAALELDLEDWFEFLEDNFAMTTRILERLCADLPPTSPPRPDLSQQTAIVPRRRMRKTGSGENLRAALGPALSLSFVERVAVLRACPALSRAGIQALARLAHFADLISLSEGDSQKLDGPALYVVEKGQLNVTTAGKGSTWHEEVHPGGLVAGLGLMVVGVFDCTATALKATTILRISTELVFDVMEDHFPLTTSLLAYTALELEAAALESQLASSPSQADAQIPSRYDAG